jgi:putative ABC transport system substrate-binding protein
MIKRREFITLLGGGVAAWPLAARAQQPQRMRRIGVLMNLASDDPESVARIATFAQGLGELGWTIGRNVQVESRWAVGDPELYRRYARELVALAPDVILAQGGTAVRFLMQATRTVPIVFANASDPVGFGLVESLARPGGNVTGFETTELSMSVKWLELLKQIAPSVTRVAVLWDPVAVLRSGTSELAAVQALAPSLKVEEVHPVGVRDGDEIERGINTFVARGSNDGLIVTAGTLPQIHRDRIIALAARHRLPAVYPFRFFVTSGGLISYGPNQTDQYRQAASYVDRILRGEKAENLPVQAPVKYPTVLNMKTAKALGLEIPPTVYALANEIIE